MEFWHYFLILIGISLVALAYFKLYWRPREHHKAQRKGVYFESSLGRIFFTRRGHSRNDKLVLIHGLGASGYCWRHLIPLLEEKYDVINIDLWGFGRSHKDPRHKINLDDHIQIISEILDDLGIGKFSIIGCSMGGAIGLWYAIKNQARVTKLVLLAPAAHTSLVPNYLKRLTWISDWTPLVVNRTLIQTFLYNIYANKALITNEAIDEYFRPYLDPKAHKTFANHLDLLQDDRVYNSLPLLEQPTLVLWGGKDSSVPHTAIQEIVRRLPQTLFCTHPDGGHHLMEEFPAWCADKILPFLKST